MWSQVLKHIVRSLEDSAEGVRAAAAVCVMALSRSIPTLRSSLLEAEVAGVLCRLLSDSCVDVQVWMGVCFTAGARGRLGGRCTSFHLAVLLPPL